MIIQGCQNQEKSTSHKSSYFNSDSKLGSAGEIYLRSVSWVQICGEFVLIDLVDLSLVIVCSFRHFAMMVVDFQ